MCVSIGVQHLAMCCMVVFILLLNINSVRGEEENIRWVWTKATSLAPLDLEPNPIPVCDVTTKGTCIDSSPQPMSWERAHAYCRGLNGFLPSRDEYRRLLPAGQKNPLNSNLTWTALTPFLGHYQWMSGSPEIFPATSDFIEWEGGRHPELWSRDCAALEFQREEFRLHNCSAELPFYCVVLKGEGNSPAAEVTLDYRDVELRVEGSQPPDPFGWLHLKTKDFDDLTLHCKAYNRTTGAPIQHTELPVFWRKDNVYVGHAIKDLQLSTLHDSTKFESISPGVLERNPISTNQGTYWCETWVPGSPDRLSSNKMLITLQEWFVIIFNAHTNENKKTLSDIKASLIRSFSGQFPTISSNTLDPITVVKESIPGTTEIQTKFSFHFHFSSNITHSLRAFEIRRKKYSSIYKRNGFLDSSSVEFPTLCFSHTTLQEAGPDLKWPFSEVGYVHPQNYKCKTKYGKLKAGLCMWNYTHGAHIEFDPVSCDWRDPCPKGYVKLGDRYCVGVTVPNTWAKSFNDAYYTGQEKSVLDHSESEYLRHEIQAFLAEQGKGGQIWLPAKRKQLLGPLTFMGLQQSDVDVYNYLKISNISWAEGHPHSNEDCLAMDMELDQLQTINCDEKLPFVTIIDATFLRTNVMDKPDRWDSLVTESPMCDSGWMSTGFIGGNEVCFRLFSNGSKFNYSEADEECQANGATLPFPNVGFLDWVYRQYLHSNDVNEVWMGIQWVNERLYYEGELENINWKADTTFGQNKSGVLTTNGWTMENEAKRIENVLCQKIVYSPVPLQLTIQEPVTNATQTMCINLHPINMSMNENEWNLKCYVNGEYRIPANSLDNKCDYEMALEGQGYYQCQAWARSPLDLVKSNIILQRDERTLTYVVTFIKDISYNPKIHDSTFKASQRGILNSERCEDGFMTVLRSSSLEENYRFALKHLYYLPSGPEQKLLHTFHLECKSKYRIDLSEQEILEKLRSIFAVNMEFPNCMLKNILSTVGCSRSVTVDYGTDLTRNLTWPETQGNSVVLPEQLCITSSGEPVTRDCLGEFLKGYSWSLPESNCTGSPSLITQGLWEINRNLSSFFLEPKTSSLANLTSNSTMLQPVDIHFVAKSFESLSKDEMEYSLDFEQIVETINNVMSANASVFEPVQKKLNSSATLLKAFEDLAFKVRLPNERGDQNTISSKKFVSAERLDLEADSTIVGYKSREKGTGTQRVETLKIGSLDLKDAEAAIILPSNLTYTIAAKRNGRARSLIEEDEKVHLAFAVYRNEKLFQDSISLTNYSVNSPIIQASYSGAVVKDLNYPIKIYFKPLLPGDDTKCVFWDFLKNGGQGGWAEDGCMRGEREGGHDVCLCSHLTCFAQLINYDEDSSFSETHAEILDVITITGCCLSIFSLLLVFTTFFLFKKWRRSLSNKILVNLSFSIFCSIVIFLAGINQVWNVILCRGVAVSLHYFILASFGWMLVEAVHQYLKFVKVVGTYIPRFLWKASVCAWGIPVIPILIVLVYDSSLYDSHDDDYDDAKICWMSVDGFKFAFLPPLLLTMLVNLVMFSKIIHGAICGRARVNSTMSERTLFMNQLRMAISVFFLLGFTWIFGVLAVSQARVVFSYLFCIFNTLQGLFIFIFHVFRDGNARKYWREFLSVFTKDPISSSPGNSLNQPYSCQFRAHPDNVSFDKCGGILVLPQGPPLRHHRRNTRTSLLSTRTASTLVHSRVSFNP